MCLLRYSQPFNVSTGTPAASAISRTDTPRFAYASTRARVSGVNPHAAINVYYTRARENFASKTSIASADPARERHLSKYFVINVVDPVRRVVLANVAHISVKLALRFQRAFDVD